jgi:serine/threonine-protein kinase
MATVWAARIRGVRGFQRIVAVKLLSSALRAEPDAQAMFLDEARLSARIVHPNVAQILDYGEAHKRPYMALEWIDGESLARIASAQRARGGLLPLRWVLHVAAAACAGLHAAHEARDQDGEPLHLVHRDVSPQNIMVTFDGFAKVVDFGVAKSRRRTQITRVGVIKGKTGYFSPEQVRGEEIDRRSDLFSFGILLYLLVTDRHPFRGRSAVDTIQNIATRVPYAPRDLCPDLPPALDELILRALAKDPADRFQTAAEMQAALELVGAKLGGRLTDREVGAVALDLLPGVAEGRRARLARVVDRLDRNPSPRSAREAPVSSVDAMQPAELQVAFECTATQDRMTVVESSPLDLDGGAIDVVFADDEQTRGERWPAPSESAPAQPAPRPEARAPSLARLTAVTTLALLFTAMLAASARERLVTVITPSDTPSAATARSFPQWLWRPLLLGEVKRAADSTFVACPAPAAAPAPASVVRRKVPPPPRRKRPRPPAAAPQTSHASQAPQAPQAGAGSFEPEQI